MPRPVQRRRRSGAGRAASAVLATSVTVLLALVALATAAPGDLDSTFGESGTQSVPAPPNATGSSVSQAYAVTAAAGGYVMAGTASSSSGPGVLVRLTSSGALATGFNFDGRVYEPLASRFLDILADGTNVVAVGQSESFTNKAFIARYDATNGDRDSTFGAGGSTSVPLAGYEYASFEAVAQYGTGYVAVGWAQDVDAVGAPYVLLVVRFDSTGAVVGTPKTHALGGAVNTKGRGVAVEGSNIVVAGEIGTSTTPSTTTPHALIARFDGNGDLDTTFSAGDSTVGWSEFAPTNERSEANDVVIVGTRYVIGGTYYPSATPHMFVAAFSSIGSPSGGLDTTFGDGADGYTITTAGKSLAVGNALAFDSSIVLAGYAGPSPHEMALVRFSSTGIEDATFGPPNGYVTRTIGSGGARADDVVVDGNRYVAAGSCGSGTAWAFAAAAFIRLSGTAGTGGSCTTTIGGSSGGSSGGASGGGGSAPTTTTTPAPAPAPGSQPAPPTAEPEMNVVVGPRIAGPAFRRGTLRADRGQWTGNPTLTHRWERCVFNRKTAQSECAVIEKAGSKENYTLPKDFTLGERLRLVVTATRTKRDGTTETKSAVGDRTDEVREFTWPAYAPKNPGSGRKWTFTRYGDLAFDLVSRRGVCLVDNEAQAVAVCGNKLPLIWDPDFDNYKQVPAEMRDDISSGDVFDADKKAGDVVRPLAEVEVQYYDDRDDPPGVRCSYIREDVADQKIFDRIGKDYSSARASLQKSGCTVAEDYRQVYREGQIGRLNVTGAVKNPPYVTLQIDRTHPCSPYFMVSDDVLTERLGRAGITVPTVLGALVNDGCDYLKREVGERRGIPYDKVIKAKRDFTNRRVILEVAAAPDCDYADFTPDATLRAIGTEPAAALKELQDAGCFTATEKEEADGVFTERVGRVKIDKSGKKVTLVVLTQKAPECQQNLTFGPISVSGTCLHREGLVWTSKASVTLGGLKLVPNGAGAQIVIDPLNLRVAAKGNAKVAFGPGTFAGRAIPETIIYEGSFEWTWQGFVDPNLTNRLMDLLRNRLASAGSGGGAPQQGNPLHYVRLPDLPTMPQLRLPQAPGFPEVTLPDFSKIKFPTELAKFPGVSAGNLEIPSLNLPSVTFPDGLIPKFELPPLCVDTKQLPVLAGAPFNGKACATLNNEGVRLRGEVTVPLAAGATANASIFVFRDGRIQFENLNASAGPIELGPLTVQSLNLAFIGSENRWHGDGDARLFDKGPSRVAVKASIDVIDGRVRNGSFLAEADGLGVPIGPTGIFLNGIGARYDSFPSAVIGGRGVFGFGPAVNGVRLAKLDAGLTYEFGPRVLIIDGKLFVVGNEAAKAKVMFSPTEVRFDGGFGTKFERDLGLFGKQKFEISGQFAGFIAGSRFQIDGLARADLNGNYILADATVSNKGIASCLESKSEGGFGVGPIQIDWKFEFAGGVGYLWETREVKPFGGGSCGMEDFRIAARQTARSAQAGGGRTVTLASGMRQVSLLFKGEGAPPRIVLTGPGGERIVAPADGRPVSEPSYAVIPDAVNNTTTVMLAEPKGGRWTATTSDRKPITQVLQADPLPESDVDAKVIGSGHRRMLQYSATAIPGQTITFREEGKGVARVLREVRGGGRGEVRFRPAPGPKGSRRIVALVEQDGIPRSEQAVARYSAPGPFVPRRVEKVSLARRGTTVRVGWRQARGATGYVVKLRFNDGAVRRSMVGPRRRSLAVGGVLRGRPVRVTVAPVGELGRVGRSREARLKSIRLKRAKDAAFAL